MIPATILKYFLRYGLPILALILVIWYVFSLGSKHGEANVQAKWDQQKKLDSQHIQSEQEKITKQEAQHRTNDRKISDELAKIKANEAGTIARIRGEYALRLQDSESRSSVYRVASEGGSSERAGLASYAAELDRSLSEGISLVEELQATLEVRDGQVKALSSQIINDRELINGSGKANEQAHSDSTAPAQSR